MRLWLGGAVGFLLGFAVGVILTLGDRAQSKLDSLIREAVLVGEDRDISWLDPIWIEREEA